MNLSLMAGSVMTTDSSSMIRRKFFGGSFLGYAEGSFRWGVFVFGLLTTLCLQILSNLANDYGDALKGTDNEKRIGPQRVTQSGLVTRKQMRHMIGLFVTLSLIAGSLLIYSGLRGTGSILFTLFLKLKPNFGS